MEDAASEGEGWLLRHPVLSSVFLVLVYIVFVLIPYFFTGPPGEEGPAYFLIATITTAFLWLVIVPRGLGLPHGRQPLDRYLDGIRLSQVHPVRRNIVLGLSAVSIYLTSALISSFLTGSYVFDPAQILPPDSWILLVAFVPGIWEEIAFRGVILTLLARKYDKTRSMVISSVLFSVPHLINLLGVERTTEVVLGVLAQVGYAFVIGLFLTYLVFETDSLLPAIVIHYLIDAVGPLVIFTPGADAAVKSLLMVLGTGIVPSLLSYLLVSRWEKGSIN